MATKRVNAIWSMLLVAALGLWPRLSVAAIDSGSTGSNGAFPPAAQSCTEGSVPTGATVMTVDLRTGTVSFAAGGVVSETRPIMMNCQTATPVPSTGFPDGILHFTTLTVPSGVTLRFIRNDLNTPVQILTRADATVAGTIDVSGSPGGAAQQGNGKGGLGGPGGFKGGNGQTFTTNPKAGDGLGPGGGGGGAGPSSFCASGAGFGTVGGVGFQNGGPPGAIYATSALLPLVGGSGGGGGPSTTSGGTGNGGGGGGGGGGAILIASSTTIDVTGKIDARGGSGGSGCGAGGSGGAIRLFANTLRGNGTLDTSGGGGTRHDTWRFDCCNFAPGGGGGLGRIRLEANFFEFAGSTTGNRSDGGPGFVFLPNTPSVRIVSVNSTDVSAAPLGGFGGADIAVPGPGAYTIALEARNVPLGTTIAVTAKPETDVANPASATSTPLAGTAATATATATMTFESGGLYFLEARATFQLP